MCQNCEGNCGLWVLNDVILKKGPADLKKNCRRRLQVTQIGLDCLCYLAGNSQTAPTTFFKFSGYVFNQFIKNRQTTIVLKLLTQIVSGIDGLINLPLLDHIVIE